MEVATGFYESDEAFGSFAEMHFGPEYLRLRNFQRAVVQEALAASDVGRRRYALDLGCSLGRATFELSREFAQVDGVDLSVRFIEGAQELAASGMLKYSIAVEGSRRVQKVVRLDELGLGDNCERVRFINADAARYTVSERRYDMVLALNLIDRLPDPREFLRNVGRLVVPGGIFVLSSPYTWLKEYTPVERWLSRDGSSAEEVAVLLAGQFDQVGSAIDMPFCIRETARKFQYVVADLTMWRRSDDI